MTLKDQLDALLDATVFDSTGTKIGAVRQVYVDDASGKITFATVSTGIFSSDAIVPLHGARLLDDELHVDHTRSVIRDSPRPDHTEDALTAAQEVKLLEYYGIEAPVRGQEAAPTAPSRTRSTTPQATAPAEKLAERGSETSPATDGGGTPGTIDRKKTDKKTTTSSPEPEVGEVGEARKPAKPGTTQAGETEPKGRGAGEPKGESGSPTSPDHG